MTIYHDTLVWLAKSFGLIYLMILSVIIVVYAYWPKNKQRFDAAAQTIFPKCFMTSLPRLVDA